MLNEAVKKQMLSSDEYFKATRYEGKPFKFKFKYLYANYPEFLLMGLVLGGIAPLVVAYRYFSFENSKRDVIKKFKSKYTVVRDDHPLLDRIIAEKKLGKEFFPK